MYANRTAYTVAVSIVFILVVLLAMQIGAHSRSMLTASKTVAIQTPEEAFAVWTQSGVRGRTLILFDNYPHMNGLRSYNGLPKLNHWNVIEYSIFKNIIRRINLIVPEENWSEFLKRGEIRPISSKFNDVRNIYLTTTSGVPMITSIPASIQKVSEKVLVYINTDFYDYEKTINLLREKGIQSDLIILYGGGSK